VTQKQHCVGPWGMGGAGKSSLAADGEAAELALDEVGEQCMTAFLNAL